ncbi:MAG: ABC transporter substrate-binding protein, partial [Tepidanaerobacteraceae bacterium]|nr:ABC transporter substrate-binding protein [Tepidanaerobacteraceae bacterium]
MKKRFVALLLILCFLIAACSNTPLSPMEQEELLEEEMSGTPQSGGSITLATTAILNLDPLMAKDDETKSILSLIYEGLVKIDGQGKIQSGLAEDWQVTNDARTYTFNLRTDVKWHNGQAFTSADVKATFDKIVELKKQLRKENRPDFNEFDNIQSYEALDEKTFTISLYKPDVGFLYEMNRGILPASIIEKSKTDKTDDELTLEYIGTGPYKVVGWKSNSITLHRNDYYSDKPYIDEINFRRFPDNNSIKEAFTNQTIDLAIIESEDWNIFQNMEDVYLLQCPSRYFEFISLNLNNPLLSDVKVRQAMLMGINRDRILQDTTLGRGIVIDGPILPFSWAFNSQVQHVAYNPKAALQMLQEAGWKDEDEDGILEKTIGNKNYKFEIELLVNTANGARYQAASHIEKDLKALGISVKLVNVTWDELKTNVMNKKFDAAIMGWKLTPNPDLRFMFASSEIKNGYNFVSYSDTELDVLLIRANASEEGRQELLFKTQEIINKDLPYLFLYSPNKLLALNKRLKG